MSVANRKKLIVPESPAAWLQLHRELGHVFTPHHPVDELDLFTGRLDLVEKLQDSLALRGRHAIIYGDRGVGKSSFANLLSEFLRNPKEEIECIKRSAAVGHHFSTIWHDLLDEALFNDRTAKQILRDTENPTDVIRLLQTYSKSKKTIFILDEFDRIEDARAKLLLSDLIKNVSDNLKHISIVLVGVGRNIGELFENHASLPRSVEQIYMPHMSDDELRLIITDRIPDKGMAITATLTEAIVRLSDGFPAYTHALTLNAARAAVKRRSVEIVQQDLDLALKAVVRDAKEGVAAAYETAVASPRANLFREVLAACALAKSDDHGRFEGAALIKPLSKILGRDVTAATFNKNLDAFCQKERGPVLIREGTRKHYKYAFADPLVRPYVIMRGRVEGLLHQNHLR